VMVCFMLLGTWTVLGYCLFPSIPICKIIADRPKG